MAAADWPPCGHPVGCACLPNETTPSRARSFTGRHILFTRIHTTVHLYVRTHRRPLIHVRPAWAPNGPRIGGQACTGSTFAGPYDKLGEQLVRDGIPRIIEAGDGQPVTRVLDQTGYLAALRAKLMEEAEEARSAPDRQFRSELADVLEVLRALAAAHGMSWEDVEAEAARKRDERGGFDQRIFLEYVEQVG